MIWWNGSKQKHEKRQDETGNEKDTKNSRGGGEGGGGKKGGKGGEREGGGGGGWERGSLVCIWELGFTLELDLSISLGQWWSQKSLPSTQRRQMHEHNTVISTS